MPNCAMILPVKSSLWNGLGGDGKNTDEKRSGWGCHSRRLLSSDIHYSSEQLPEYMSLHLPKVGGVCRRRADSRHQYGAGLPAGARVMTGSSSPDIALKQENQLYGGRTLIVIVNMMRGGPDGSIQLRSQTIFNRHAEAR